MLPYTGFGIPLVAFNSVTNLETSSVGTGAPVLAEGASTTSNKVFNSIKGDGTTTQVTLAPLLTGGDITVACTSNMLDKTTDQTIDSIKTFTKNPVVTNNAGDTGVIVNHIGTAGTGVGFAVAQDSASRIELGYNPTSTETYLWSKGAIDLKIATNNTERLRIKGTGLAVDNAGTPLAVSSTTLCLRNNLVDTSSTQTITGVKTFSSAPVMSAITNGAATLTLPTTTSTLLSTTSNPTFATQTLTTGLLLPTAGGTPTLLTGYEEAAVSHSWSGPWSARSGTVTYTKIGRMVIATFGRVSASATANNNRIASDTIPARFRPSERTTMTIVPAFNNSSAITATLVYDIGGAGVWNIWPSVANALNGSGGFSGSGTAAFFEFSICYIA